jgi:hypothetical protein
VRRLAGALVRAGQLAWRAEGGRSSRLPRVFWGVPSQLLIRSQFLWVFWRGRREISKLDEWVQGGLLSIRSSANRSMSSRAVLAKDSRPWKLAATAGKLTLPLPPPTDNSVSICGFWCLSFARAAKQPCSPSTVSCVSAFSPKSCGG